MKLISILTIIVMFFIGVYSVSIIYTEISVAAVEVSTMNIKNLIYTMNLDTIIDVNSINNSFTLFDFGIYDYSKFLTIFILCFVMGNLIYISLSKYGRKPLLISLIIGFSYIFTIQYAISFIIMDFNWVVTLSYFISCLFGVMMSNLFRFIFTGIHKRIYQ
ncbi:hypothetical protein KHQ82_06990 [Mycoplasmatota bacterium]|nr:hypothetical protein KHQ82_06990 [Mycoplasmatota bacterium]